MTRTSKVKERLASLLALFDSFYQSLEGDSDPRAQRLLTTWSSIRHLYEATNSAFAPSKMSAVLEQNLLELPMWLESMDPSSRLAASNALAMAIRENLPAFQAEHDERLAKVLARGSIRGESEFYLVRHAVDIAEGNVEQTSELSALYALIEKFETRGRRDA